MDKTAYVLVGVVLGVFLNALKEWWFQRGQNRKDLVYLTIRFACVLDTFVNSCVDVVADDGLCNGQPDPNGDCSIQVKTPKFEPLEIEVEWKSLPSELMYELLNFPNLIESANHTIDDAFEYLAIPPDYAEGFEKRQIQYANLGLKAHALSEKLRKIGGLPLAEVRSPEDWDPVRYMAEKQLKIGAYRAASRKSPEAR
ncbi:MAG: hypothetical protein HOP34_04575 [Methylococcaceae bacterium]|nr:hypothetical protein [Methylococcaceae bacterium]